MAKRVLNRPVQANTGQSRPIQGWDGKQGLDYKYRADTGQYRAKYRPVSRVADHSVPE